ncbi:MAG TPA: tRNA (adenosine(37)-N6)-threonylcarbamoyltransferase complex transferase subunit TsaD [Polyangiaceae bacterium]
MMITLGIETSCDETGVAVVKEDGTVLSDAVQSQIALHAPFGGVVPELASRDHLTNLLPVFEQALAEARVTLSDIDGLAVTCRPGLSGALLVGIQFAKGLAWACNKPLVGVDHLVGHLVAAQLQFPGQDQVEHPEPPFIALLVSGGHTAIYRVDDFDVSKMHELGATRDDAAGEAFDKVAKLLGLGYPGGPVVDRLAHEGNPLGIALTRPMPQSNLLEFSFSGIKTQVMRWVNDNGLPRNDSTLRDLCASFQHRVVEVLVRKTVIAARREGINKVVVGGGVAANRGLRERLKAAAQKHELKLFIPSLRACTDNAAMIAYAGSLRLARGADDRDSLEMSPHSALLSVTKKGRGRRELPRTARSE